jgi:hypothetical protein
VNDGILSKEAYQEWAGKYIHRSYEKHLGLKGAITNIKQIPDYLRGRMGESKSIAPIIARGKIWRGGKKEYQGYVNSGQIGKVSDGKIEAIQDLASGKYTFRRDWTKAEREAMGEITDAAYSIPETLLRLQTMKQNGAFLRDVEGVKGAVLDESAGRIANDKLKGSGYDRVPNNAKYGVLADRAVRADVLSDINAFNDNINRTLFGSDNPIAKAWLGYLGAWKKSKTLWNAPTHLNNFNSNLFLMHLSGMRSNEILGSLKSSAKLIYTGKDYEALAVKASLGKLTPKEAREYATMQTRLKYYIEAKESGVFGRSQLNDILRGHLEGFAPKSILGKLDGFTQKLYQGEDNINRLAMYSFLRDKQGFNIQEAKRFVLSIMPDYTRPMPAGFRFLRDSGISPFISWSYYTIPTIIRLLKTKQGAMQAAKVLGALALMESVAGVNPLDNLPFVDGDKPSDFKGRRFAYNKNGNIVDTIKLDRQIPYVELMHPLNMIVGLGSGVTTKAGVNFFSSIGKNGAIDPYTGRPVSPATRSAGETAYDWTKYAISNYAPIPPQAMGLWDTIERQVAPKKRKPSEIQARNNAQELAKAVGLNLLSYKQKSARSVK